MNWISFAWGVGAGAAVVVVVVIAFFGVAARIIKAGV